MAPVEGFFRQADSGALPPSPPNPSSDRYLIPNITSPRQDAPSPPSDEDWDVNDMETETAAKILVRSLEALVNANGDIPPTPPLSRPTTPRSNENAPRHHHRRTSSRPATPVPNHDIHHPTFKPVDVDAPEAGKDEHNPGDIGVNAQPPHVQQASLARKFFSKNAPAVSIEGYVLRLQKYCPMSTAVYLAAAAYIHRLSIEDKIVPITPRTVHRLILGTLRCAMKALEDLSYSCDRFAKVGGVGLEQLRQLELTVCYLIDFDLQVTGKKLHDTVNKFQKAAQQAQLSTRLPSTFELKLSLRSGVKVRG